METLTVFFDFIAIMHRAFLLQSQAINYLQDEGCLHEAILKKMPRFMENQFMAIVSVHNSLFIREFLTKNYSEMMPHQTR